MSDLGYRWKNKKVNLSHHNIVAVRCLSQAIATRALANPYLASRARAIAPDTKAAAALVPAKFCVHFPSRSVVTCSKGLSVSHPVGYFYSYGINISFHKSYNHLGRASLIKIAIAAILSNSPNRDGVYTGSIAICSTIIFISSISITPYIYGSLPIPSLQLL